MPLNTSMPVKFDSRRIAALRRSLQEFFGVDFVLWFFDKEWMKIADDESCDLEVVSSADAEQLESIRKQKLERRYLTIAGPEETLLVIPLPKRQRQQIVAAARFKNSQIAF